MDSRRIGISMDSRRIGIFGGTFDPIHVGHTVIAKQAQEQHDLNKVYFVVTADPYQKETPGASFEQRVQMARLALQKHSSWAVPEDIERRIQQRRPGPSLMIDVLYEFQRICPTDKRFLIVGSDCDLSTWKYSENYYKTCLISKQYRWLNLSSTTIRERIANDLPVTDLIDDRVYDYIQNEGLYQ